LYRRDDDTASREEPSSSDEEEEKGRRTKVPKNKGNDDDLDEDEDDGDSSEAEGDKEDDVLPKKKSLTKPRKSLKKKAPKDQTTSPRAAKNSEKNRATVHKSTENAVAGTGKVSKTKIFSALTMLAKKVLVKDVETPENSLVAALLAAAKPIPKLSPTVQRRLDTPVSRSTDGSVASKIESVTVVMTYPQLDDVARHLVRNFEPNAMHIQLLNLLFRSVGGSVETNIPKETDLEELEDEQWDDVISQVVTVMRDEADADQTLLCADYPPPPPQDQQQKVGVIAFRAIYKEFWYRLGHVILAHAPAASTNASTLIGNDEENADEDTDDDSIDSMDFDKQSDHEAESTSPPMTKKTTKMGKTEKGFVARGPEKFSSNRFQLEMMRDLISRLTEFVTVGQPDLRSSGTLAIFQLGKACMERTVELETKIQIATRQFKAAKQSQSKTKMASLKNAMDAWKRHKAEIEEIVNGQVIQAVFIHRYRDANATLRKDSLDALSEISLIRPDVFLVDTYLKYFAWMTFDKDAAVRMAALYALLAPFKAYEEQLKQSSASKKGKASSSSSSPYKVDISTMQHVTMKFLSRFVDCVHDGDDVRVQEVALKLLLAMLHADFLEEWDEDEGWDSVNMKCLDTHSSPQVRRDALYFVLEQLDSFDPIEGQLAEKKLMERVASLAGWYVNSLLMCHSVYWVIVRTFLMVFDFTPSCVFWTILSHSGSRIYFLMAPYPLIMSRFSLWIASSTRSWKCQSTRT
jgi:hypothetical protein